MSEPMATIGRTDRGVQPFDACQVRPSVTARGRWTGKSMWDWNPGDRLTILANGQEYRMAIIVLTSGGEWEAIAEDRFIEEHEAASDIGSSEVQS